LLGKKRTGWSRKLKILYENDFLKLKEHAATAGRNIRTIPNPQKASKISRGCPFQKYKSDAWECP
jgi:hypothetical protein